jgi:hypothetical protein
MEAMRHFEPMEFSQQSTHSAPQVLRHENSTTTLLTATSFGTHLVFITMPSFSI